MWESKNQLKLADRYVRIGILVFFLLVAFTLRNQIQSSSNIVNPLDQPLDQDEPIIFSPQFSGLKLSEIVPPEIKTSPTNLLHEEDATGNPRLRWKLGDSNPNKYQIYHNGNKNSSGTWTNQTNVDQLISGLERGFHNFTLFANDTDGNFVIQTLNLTVIDTFFPIFTLIPLSFNITEDSVDNEISWSASDFNALHSHSSNYIIDRNTTEVKTGSWVDNEPITLNFDGLISGVYNFTIYVFDDSGNSISNSVIINSTDASSPVVLSSVSPLRFSEFDVGRNLVINATDRHPNTYQIFQNLIPEAVKNGTWGNTSLIIYNLDNLVIGNYTFSIYLYDEFLNEIQIDIDVEIYKVIFVESKEPQFTITTQVHEGDYEAIQSEWLDFQDNPISNGSITLTLYEDQLLIDTKYYLNQTNPFGIFTLTLNYTGLPASDYRWEINFTSIEHISQSLQYNFTVLPHIYEISVTPLANLTQGEEYEIEVTVTYANSQSGLSLNSLVPNTGTASGVAVDFEMLVILMAGGQSTISKSGTSNSDGKVTFTLSIFETSIIASVESITIQTVDDQFSNPTSIELTVNQFPVIISTESITDSNTQSSTNVDQGSDLQIIEDYLPLILGGLFGLFFLIFIFRKMRKASKQKSGNLQEVYDLALAEVMGISTIQLVMLISSTGLPLYERKFKTMGVDTLLLSGVTSAISSLLSEANDQQIFGLEIMENRGLSITSHKGSNSSLLFISSKSLPMTILSQIIEAHETIEVIYGEGLFADGSVHIPEEEINQIFRDHELKLDLSSDIEIDIFALDKFHSDGKTKNGVKSLAGVLLEVDLKELEMQDVGRLIEIYEENGFDRGLAANFILRAYNEGMIKSKIK